MISALALAFASLGSSSDALAEPARPARLDNVRAGVVQGTARGRIDGRQASCEGVLLIPRSNTTDASIERLFGSSNSGHRILSPSELEQRRNAPPAYPAGARAGSCNSYPWSFTFRNVAPGEYYITARLSAPDGSTDPALRFPARAVDLMQRVQVAPGGVVEVELRKD